MVGPGWTSVMLPAEQSESTLPACLLQLRQQLHHVHAALKLWGDSGQLVYVYVMLSLSRRSRKYFYLGFKYAVVWLHSQPSCSLCVESRR